MFRKLLYGLTGLVATAGIALGAVVLSDGTVTTPVVTYNATGGVSGASGVGTETSSSVSNVGIAKSQLMIYNGSAGNLVPGSSAGSSADANAAANMLSVGANTFNGATWDRQRSSASDGAGSTGFASIQPMAFNGASYDRVRAVGGVANVGTGVLRTQPEEGYTSSLNVTAATTIKATAGRIFKVNVIVAGATGQICDNNAACAAANVVFQIPATVGTYDLNWPMGTGIRAEPGAAQVLAISWQ